MGNWCPKLSRQQDSGTDNYNKLIEGEGSRQQEECQQIDVENDDEFEKKQDQAPAKNPTKKLMTINDFHAVKTLGRGGFGKVLLVERKDGNRKLYAMKIIKKEMVSKRNQQIHTRAERKIMQNMRCPFIVQLHYAFQSQTSLYLIMDFMIGGELFFHLRRQKKFTEQRAKLYAAQIVLALDYLHKKNIIYRDLKPENILMGADGYLKITDFGLSKEVISMGEKSYTFCGTPEYLAPEIYQNRGHDFTCDWWSLGALIYEMMCGAPPFYSKDKQKMLEDRLHKDVIMKDYFTSEAADLLRGLLAINPKVRLGRNGGQQIKSHPFFKDLDWNALYAKKLPMPFKPEVGNEKDLGNFDKVFTNEEIKETPARAMKDEYENYTYSKQQLVA